MVFLLASWFVSVSTVLALPVSASDDMLDVLTCSTQLPQTRLQDIVQSEAFEPVQDGRFRLIRPYKSNGFCLENANVSAAFGVLIVMGQSCTPNAEPLLSLFKSRFTHTPSVLPSGYLFMGKSHNDEAMIFKGLAEMPPKVMPTSKTIAYTCSRQFGGTQ